MAYMTLIRSLKIKRVNQNITVTFIRVCTALSAMIERYSQCEGRHVCRIFRVVHRSTQSCMYSAVCASLSALMCTWDAAAAVS